MHGPLNVKVVQQICSLVLLLVCY